MDSREAIALQNQILELRHDFQMLQQQRGGYAVPPPQARGYPPGAGGGGEIAAQLLDRVATLEEEVRRLRGQLDEQSNRARRQYDELSKQNADLQFRLQQGAASPPGGTGGGALPTNPPAATPAAPVRRTPELAMQEGNAALARRDYATAEAAAREVIQSGRNTPRTADAHYLLAQSLAGRKDYQGAAIAYDDAYKANRQGSRAAESLLGLATSLLAINERQAACVPLDKIRTDFPSIRGDLKSSVASARSRAGCR